MGKFLTRVTSFWVLRRSSWFGFLISLGVGLLFFLASASVIDTDANLRFTSHARNAQNTISARIKSYTDALRGAASLFQTSDRITREQFHAYVAGLSLKQYFPALVAINYAEYVRGDEMEQFVRRVRAEQAIRPFGDRMFSINPPGKRSEYSVLTFIEDEIIANANDAFGFDMFSLPYAPPPMLASRDSGLLVTSGRPVAAISKPHSTGLGIRLPVYRPGMPVNTVAERRAAYIGSVGIAFNLPGLVNGVLDAMLVKNVRMVLTNADAEEASKNKPSVPVRPLFDSLATAERPYPPLVAVPNTFTVSLPIDFNGRPLNAAFIVPKSSVYSHFDVYFPWLAMASGFGGSMLIYALFHTLASSRSRAIAMANSMTQELRDSQVNLQLSHQKLRRLVAHADHIKEGERKRIAREIHDDLGQNLLALRIEAELLANRTAQHHQRLHARAQTTLLQIDATIKSVRQIINDLRPNVLDLGLSAAVEWQIAEFIRRTGIECQLVVGRHDINVNDNCATAFFRILQESLSNIVRHAKASTVRVELNSTERDLWMTIEDNGVGLPDSGRNKPGSFGLVGIEERISILGGAFSIHSEDGHGTSVFVSVPMPDELKHAAAVRSSTDTPEIELA